MENITLGKRERTLIDFFEYKLIGPDNSNRWIVLDKNDNNVGYIQYKKIKAKNEKYPALYGFETNIDSQEIVYSGKSSTNSKESDSFAYEFHIKRENDELEYVEIDLGNCPSITLRNKEYGYINFRKDNQLLYLDFPSKTDNFNLKETVILRSSNEGVLNQEYIYNLSYCDKTKDINSANTKGITTRELVGKSNWTMKNLGQIVLYNKSWSGDNLKMDREDVVFGTLEEMILKQQNEICTFEHFKYIINKLWPFESEVVSKLLENCELSELEKLLIGFKAKNNKK